MADQPLLMNAAGWAKNVRHVKELARVPTITHIVVGSFTMEARPGNMGGTNFRVFDDGTSINSLGLPNGGIDYLRAYGREMVSIAHAADKRLVVSIAGFTVDEYDALVRVACEIGADIVEANGGCPNAFVGPDKKAPLSFDPMLVRELLGRLRGWSTDLPIWFKTSPFSDPSACTVFAAIIRENRWLSALVSTNTYPDASAYLEDGKPALDVAYNFGGMAGTGLKPIALGQCRKLAQLLPGIPIIGAGGIAAGNEPEDGLRVGTVGGRDLRDYVHIGCVGGQIGTSFFKDENFRIFEDVMGGFLDLSA